MKYETRKKSLLVIVLLQHLRFFLIFLPVTGAAISALAIELTTWPHCLHWAFATDTAMRCQEFLARNGPALGSYDTGPPKITFN